ADPARLTRDTAAAVRFAEPHAPSADPSRPAPLPPDLPQAAGGATATPAREAGHQMLTPRDVAQAPDVERFVRLGQQLHTGRDSGEMRLELSREGLGQVEVRVVVRADAVHATLYAQQDHARQMLAANRPALAEALGRSQLRLEGFSVDIGQQHDRHESA